MFYIQEIHCISPQQTFPFINLYELHEPVNNKLNVIEPAYEGIPKNALRRMSKTVRISVGATLPILKNNTVSGIIIGTANGGMEDSIVFLKQVIEFDEGILTPGNFVQSTSNATASQLSLISSNRSYNITHVHRGLAFENAIIDAAMQLMENGLNTYLLGGVDEIASYNYNIDYLDNWYKTKETNSSNFYNPGSPGSIAGEGAVMLLVNNNAATAIAKLKAIQTMHNIHVKDVSDGLKNFIEENLQPGEQIDILLSGENGDNRLIPFYEACESLLDNVVMVARFKHICGEYPVASSFALWLACELLNNLPLPGHMIKKNTAKTNFKNILIYNCYKGLQHSFILVGK